MTGWMPSAEEMVLLHELVSEKRPELLPVVEALPEVSLTDEQRASLDDLLSEELTASGFQEDWSINQRGEMLENLIYWIVEVVDRQSQKSAMEEGQ